MKARCFQNVRSSMCSDNYELTCTDASRFLAQSQSRISFASPYDQPSQTQRHQNSRASQWPLKTRTGMNQQRIPGFGNFGLGSKVSYNAPLFHSIAEDAGSADEEDEHEREVADYFALQRSRKHFVQGRLEGSSEIEEDGAHTAPRNRQEINETSNIHSQPSGVWQQRTHGIKSSWHGDQAHSQSVRARTEVTNAQRNIQHGSSRHLEETLRSIDLEVEDLQTKDKLSDPHNNTEHHNIMPTTHEYPPASRSFKIDSSLAQSELASETPNSTEDSFPSSAGHDRLWAQIYLMTVVAFLTSSLVVWLHVSPPSSKRPLGDTIYSAITSSYKALAVDTVVAVVVSMIWIVTLRSYARALVMSLLIGAPVVLFIFSLYPFISSFQGSQNKSSLQDKLVRWLSLIPILTGMIWIYGVYKSRLFLKRAVDFLELAVQILAANPPLVLVGFGTLAISVIWTWLWIGIFTRVFLGGHMGKISFIIDVGSWWLGIFYVVVYLWTTNLISGLQRATVAASVSQWYFHRRSVPTVPAEAVVRAALSHSVTVSFGTVCLSTFTALMIRLPVLLLPRRISALLGVFSTAIVPDNMLVFTHPATLTYAAIHSKPLAEAARGIAQLSFVSRFNRFNSKPGKVLRAPANQTHRLTLLLLYVTRLVASFGFGFGAWVHSARTHAYSSSINAYTGSLYAYVVGLIAGAIGWVVIGAMEGVLTSIVDAVLVCWESEVNSGSQVRFCKEAELILGAENEPGHDTDDSMQALYRHV